MAWNPYPYGSALDVGGGYSARQALRSATSLRSASIIGRETFDDERAMRLASDIGARHQQGCVCARVAYVQSGADAAGLQRLTPSADTFRKPLLSTKHQLAWDCEMVSVGVSAHARERREISLLGLASIKDALR
ncbi:hypothetical protein [Caballeronia sp. M1242]|uniref:hypothetical protein n=1 Tax=Caballeronia sp. M1242 TaxID=2814653 RepID=UPI0035300115